MTSEDSENLVAAISERVRESLLEAERRATEIIAEAEDRAVRIQAKAESEAAKRMAAAEDQARERIERARQALDEVGVTLSAAAEPEDEDDEGDEDEPADEEPEEEPEDADGEEFDDDAEAAELAADAVTESPEPAADSPSTEDLIAQLRGGASETATETGGEEEARLVAMNMALDGASREEVERHLAEGYEIGDPDALLDEVFSRVSG